MHLSRRGPLIFQNSRAFLELLLVPVATNNHRRHSRRKKETLELWGSLYGASLPENAVLPIREEDHPARGNESQPFKRRFNGWKFTAALLLCFLLSAVGILLALSWMPQDLSDVQGYGTQGAVTDLPSVFQNAVQNGEEAVFTEAEINRYLQDTLKFGQRGVFNVIARPCGVAVRIHDGYAELILDRLLGARLHQTISVYLTFRSIREDDGTKINLEYRGGSDILGSMPRGGTIGLISVPERYILILHPSVEGIRKTYEGFFSQIADSGYLPRFIKDENGGDNRLILQPPSS